MSEGWIWFTGYTWPTPGSDHSLETQGRAVPCYPNPLQANFWGSLLSSPGRGGISPILTTEFSGLNT